MTPRTAFIYHDVVPAGATSASGLTLPGAARYKLTPELFRAHLDAYDRAMGPSLDAHAVAPPEAVVLTFDDGGASALHPIADMLEEHGRRGRFFVVTSKLGEAGFLDAAGIRELALRGHVIGSHSHSHPPRMSALPPRTIEEEWRIGRLMLEDVLGQAVTEGSVPGGYYAACVGHAASRAGIRSLYTSEPTRRTRLEGDVQVHGRFSVRAFTAPGEVAALARGSRLVTARFRCTWSAKRLAQKLGGAAWLAMRARLLADEG
jgi:peptidoglycan/xylan/chitin deacetylase (PgdA/CDA1 family)